MREKMMGRNNKKHRKHVGGHSVFALLLVLMMIVTAGCGKGGGTTGSGGSSDAGGGEALAEVNVIPEDGIITKEQFKSVAGQDMQVQFNGQTDAGITYTWTYDASKIQNPDDQNLKVDFVTEALDDIKQQANNANDALKMTMYGEGVIAVPTLQVVLPQVWESDTGLLLKEQNGSLAKMSDVTIATDAEAGTTTLTMTISSLDGDVYLVGGITGTNSNNTDVSGDAASTNGLTGGQDSDNSSDNSGNSSSSSSGTSSSGNSSSGSGDVKNSTGSDSTLTCTISIECSTILNNMDKLTSGKEEFVPSNGLILAPSAITFTKGESVFDILQRACKAAGIYMESTSTPGYDSDYIEGINQLYEFDCGEQSGWMFSVNGWFPNYGCSKYTVENGDVIKFVYTCNLGKDVGDNSAK